MSGTNRTRHERIVSGYLHRWLTTSKQHCIVVYDCMDLLREEMFDASYVDTIVQKRFRVRQYNLFDAYVFSLVHYGLTAGRIAVIDVNKGVEPRNDREVEFNNNVIHQKPGSRFYGQFCGGNDDQDGRFGWKGPTDFSTNSGVVSLPAQDVPLEVGETFASRTLLHLIEDRGVARWPYGSTNIRVYKVIDDSFLRSNGQN